MIFLRAHSTLQKETAPSGKCLSLNKIHFCNSGADINAETRDGLTAAYFCVFCGHPSYLKEVIRHGVDIDKKYREPQRTLLHYAAEAGKKKAVKLLLRRKANTEIQAGERGLTPLHLAARLGRDKVVESLLKYGADVEARSSEGFTPLHHAARCGQDEVGKLLVASGAKVDALSGLIGCMTHNRQILGLGLQLGLWSEPWGIIYNRVIC